VPAKDAVVLDQIIAKNVVLSIFFKMAFAIVSNIRKGV